MTKATKLDTIATMSVNEELSSRSSSFVKDLKLLVKGIVLLVNTLPILTAYLVALYVYEIPLTENWANFLLVMSGGVFVMAGALVFNNWYEVDLDKKMVRTQERPTVTGSLSLKTVLNLAISFSVLGFIILAFTNFEVVLYAFIGWFTYVVLYTFLTKRKYTINTVIGSLSGAVTPLIGWAAVGNVFHVIPIIMCVALFLWQIPHTFAIAIRRYDDYKRAGVPMLPISYGFQVTKRQMFIYVLCLVPLPLYLFSFNALYAVIMTLFGLLWLSFTITGFKKDTKTEHIKWANKMFTYSLVYITIFFVGMLFATLS